jgi:hypothetical protein
MNFGIFGIGILLSLLIPSAYGSSSIASLNQVAGQAIGNIHKFCAQGISECSGFT